MKTYPPTTWTELDQRRKNEAVNWLMGALMILAAFLVIVFSAILLPSCNPAYGAELPADFYIENDRIVDAIWTAEGGTKAKKPFGILSVPCDGYEDCRQVCLRTVINNKKRYQDFGYKKFDSYIAFLGSRYCPVGAENDNGTNKFWVSNVRGSL